MAYSRTKEYARDYQKSYLSTETGKLKKLVCRAKQLSRKKGLEFDLDNEFVVQLWEDQGGLCKRTGLPLDCTSGTLQVRNRLGPSLDRVDSEKGYTRDNVELVCAQYNVGKAAYSLEEFAEICRAFLENNPEV